MRLFRSFLSTTHKIYFILLNICILSVVTIYGFHFAYDAKMQITGFGEEQYAYLQKLDKFESIIIGLCSLVLIFLLFNLLKNKSVKHISLFFVINFAIILLWIIISHLFMSLLFAYYTSEMVFHIISLFSSLFGLVIFSIILYRLSGNYTKKLTPKSE